MAYKALYRTYRPSNFDDVAGQKYIVRTLQNAVNQNKIAHAYLFCGPRGTGKTSIAKIFAKAVNCESDHDKPCLQCDNCKAVADNSHPDIVEIDAASNNGVEEVRNLIEKVKYAPIKGKYKVYIIDEVHMMSTGAFNALLKTIEEPPTHVIFILATTEPHKVIQTIISRCQRFDFTKVSKNEIIERIHTVLSAENITCDDEVIRIIAELADGGLRDALSILDQCIAYARDNLTIEHINEIYGITTVGEKIELFNDIIQKNPVGLLQKVDEFIEKGIDIKKLTEDLMEILKETIIFEYTKDSTLLHQLTSEEAIHFIQSISIKQRFSMINKMMESYDKYRFASNIGSYFEVCMLEMLDINSTSVQHEVISTIQVKKEAVISKKVVEPIKNVSRETFEDNPTIEIEEYVEPILFEEVTVQKEEPVEQKTEVMDETVQSGIKPLDDEFILSLLVGANKPEKAIDMDKFSRITDYLIDLKWARFASLLRNVNIVGSGDNYIVIGVDSRAEANEINEVDRNNDFHDFIIELLGKNKKIFAISKTQQDGIIKDFKDRMTTGTLPDPIKIDDVIKETTAIKEPTQEETILSLFGEENIIITEE